MVKKDLLYDVTQLGELFADIQLANVFADQKTFVDCTPLFTVEEIKARYTTEKQKDGFNLKQFCLQHFALPPDDAVSFISNPHHSIETHITHLWNVLTRKTNSLQDNDGGTLIHLPYPFVVPGGRFREIYYWDSYFTMLGLSASGRVDLIENMVNNFAYLIDLFGFIPNGNRTYFLSRSQPPYFSYMVELLAEEKGEKIWLQYLPQLHKEYLFWMNGADELTETGSVYKRVVKLADGSILNRYWDELNTPRPESYAIDVETAHKAKNNPEIYRNIRAACESGWDFSGRWCADEYDLTTICTIDIIPVDLNCLLFHLESSLEKAFTAAQQAHKAVDFKNKKIQRALAISNYLWNNDIGCYTDFNWKKQQAGVSMNAYACFPLFTGIAEQEKAEKVLLAIEKKLLRKAGVLCTGANTNQQWDAPNGWAPIQWIVFASSLKYGNRTLAEKIRNGWMRKVAAVFETHRKLTEKYNIEMDDQMASGGEYENQDGFGWTNGVYIAMAKTIVEAGEELQLFSKNRSINEEKFVNSK